MTIQHSKKKKHDKNSRRFSRKQKSLTLIVFLGFLLLATIIATGKVFAQEKQGFVSNESIAPDENRPMSRRINLKTKADKVQIIYALPEGKKGANIQNEPYFRNISVTISKGTAEVELTNEPIWMIEGDLPKTKKLKVDDSPFGFHPASISNRDYSYAQDIGVAWDRGGLYLMWVLSQPDLAEDYDWNMFDGYFKVLPHGMMPLKNITVAHDGMVDVKGRRRPPGRERLKKIDPSSHLEGTTYRPKDINAYSAWVRAAVERYDGDGIDDMPGLQAAAKHWQVDNEPPRLREGYTDLVLITSKAIKEADAEAKVLIGGLQLPCGEERKIRNYYRTQAPLLKELNGMAIDIVDFHWFGLAGEWKMLPEAMKIVKDDLKKYGFNNIPIWFTEMGTYSGKPGGRQG